MTRLNAADLSDTQVQGYLAGQRVARMATADAEGRPHVVPVCFAFDEQRFYIALDAKPKSVSPTRLKRVRNITANPHVSLLVDTYTEDWSQLRYVMVNGTAELEAPGTQLHTAAMPLLKEKYPQYRTMPIEEQPIIVITPTSSHTWSGNLSGDTPTTMPDKTGVDFASLARGRHVVRQFKPDPVPRELVEMALEAARWAPSPHGAQPWRFVVLTRAAPKERLADAMAADWRRNLQMDGESMEVVEIRLEKSRKRIIASPVLIIPCLYLEDLHSYPDPLRQEAEVTMAVQSLGAAVQNLLLSAYNLGLDTGWMCAPLFCPGIVREALDLPPTLNPHALINMGYGAKDPPRRPHPPVDELVVLYD
jgi:coenzyme F420-0:L-glutamate ligase/coenzyme F420-1:gamma-L-glutamate ligase